MILFLLSVLFIFVGFIIKHNIWGSGDFVSKDDEPMKCNISYYSTIVGLFILLIAGISYATNVAKKAALQKTRNIRNGVLQRKNTFTKSVKNRFTR